MNTTLNSPGTLIFSPRKSSRENPSKSRVETKPSEMTSDPGTRSEDYRDRVSWPRAETRSKLRVLGDLQEPGKERTRQASLDLRIIKSSIESSKLPLSWVGGGGNPR